MLIFIPFRFRFTLLVVPAVLFLLPSWSKGQSIPLLPMPQKIRLLEGQLRIETLSQDGINYRRVDSIPGVQNNPDEAYHLSITQKGIKIDYITDKGAFYAFQTLRQLAQKKQNKYILPFCEITDWPAFRIRGYMHDTGRSFIPPDQLLQQMELLSSYKINVFHWHLTEDIAWRMASDSFPQLTHPKNFTRFPGQFYSKDEIKKILDFAAKRHITVIPEIDMPGHSEAFRRSLGYDMQSPEGMNALKVILKEAAGSFEGLPYLHLGTDEVSFTNPNFVPEMVKYVNSLGFDVISWNPGWNYANNEVAMQQLWSYRGKQTGKIPAIDSRFHYINHFDPFADLISLFRSNILGKPESDSLLAGSILAVWNDRKTDTPEGILMENSFYPLMLSFAERLWRGGGNGYFDEIGVLYPEKGSPEEIEWLEFEERLLYHKIRHFGELPFPYVRQSQYNWKIIPPQANSGNLEMVFPVEHILLRGTTAALDSMTFIKATGATVYLRHVWGTLIPAYIDNPQPHSTAYAYTNVYSPEAQVVDAWISFQNYSRSEKDLPPPQGKWDWKDSKIWLNGKEMLPPVWENNHQNRSSEISLKNENFQSRPPSRLSLAKGWNRIVLKLPVGAFSTPELRLVRWMFTFAILNGEGLVFSEN